MIQFFVRKNVSGDDGFQNMLFDRPTLDMTATGLEPRTT